MKVGIYIWCWQSRECDRREVGAARPSPFPELLQGNRADGQLRPFNRCSVRRTARRGAVRRGDHPAVAEALRQAGHLEGKIIWDCTNPLKPNLSGLLLGTTTSAGEEVARLAPAARIVKAIPPFAESLDALPRSTDLARPATFIRGDDLSA
jgi:hypothetical protein